MRNSVLQIRNGGVWKKMIYIILSMNFLFVLGGNLFAKLQPLPIREFSKESKTCINCHKKTSLGIVQMWGDSAHHRAKVGCYECHKANASDPDVIKNHFGKGIHISTIVSPKDCGQCHAKEVNEFQSSHHAQAARILGSLDNVLAEVVEGNRGLVTEGFPHGVSAAAVNGCWQCHGSEVKVLKNGKLDPATWPNTGIGRLNPDGSRGACSACHSRHKFSVAQARQPDNCGKCHMGPDHPQKEIYEESKHGIAYKANKHKMNLGNSKWVVGEDYNAAPTCATCHMSATRKQPVNHNIGLRISWNNRPIVSTRPEISDKKLGLDSAKIGWQQRRKNMQDVCLTCHNTTYVNSFYIQYDGLIDLYNNKYAKPGLALMQKASPLLRSANGKVIPFGSKVQWTWFELWHHEGRRARHGASMMGPDITHWHGTYDLGKHLYTKMFPELKDLVEKNINGPKKVEALALNAAIDETLNTQNHQWYLGKMSEEEKAIREKNRTEFKNRYKN